MRTLLRYLIAMCIVISVPLGAYGELTDTDEPLDAKAARVLTIMKDLKACDAAFPYEIESITFSKTDAEGYLHEDYVTQIITLKTGETDIKSFDDFDNVSFKSSGPVYRDGVIILNESELYPFIISATNGHIMVDGSTPASLLPVPGDYLLCHKMGGPIKCGISTQVKSIETLPHCIDIKCATVDPALLMDCYAAGAIVGAGEEVPSTRSGGDHTSNGMLPFTLRIPVKFHWPPTNSMDHFVISVPTKGVEFSGDLGVDFDYLYVLEKSLFVTYKIFGGYKEITCEDITTTSHETKMDIYGKFDIEKEIIDEEWRKTVKIKGSKPIPRCEFLSFFWDLKLDANFEVNGKGWFDAFKSRTIKTWYKYTDNPNLAPMRNPITEVLNEESDFKGGWGGGFEFSIGPTLEAGIQTTGYDDLKCMDAGAQLSYSLANGIRISADDWKVNDQINVGKPGFNTGFYDIYSPQCKVAVGPFGKLEWSLVAGLKLDKIGPFEVDWQPINLGNLLYEWEFKPSFERLFYPAFYDVKYEPSKNGKTPTFDAKLSGHLMRDVNVGYKILDGDRNELGKKIYNVKYKNDQEDFAEYAMDVDDLDRIEATKAYIYPLIVRENGQEILASPRLQIMGVAEPVTVRVDDISHQSAKIYGKIDDYPFMSETARVGFRYWKNGSSISEATNVICHPDNLGKFSATISDLQPNQTYIVAAYILDDSRIVIGNEINFTTLTPLYVDLGLSVDWSSMNVGASKPSEYGQMLAWAEIESKTEYSWSTYFDCPYDASGNWIGCQTQTVSLAGDKNHDAVASADDMMRMPTVDEVRELINGCNWEWGELDGVAGYYVRSRTNSNYIFLPAVGIIDGTDVKNNGIYGGYWTSSIRDISDHATAANLYFLQSMRSTQYSNRYIGRAVRGVHPKD